MSSTDEEQNAQSDAAIRLQNMNESGVSHSNAHSEMSSSSSDEEEEDGQDVFSSTDTKEMSDNTNTNNVPDEDEEVGTRTSPYHLIGACCFCTSIIMGVICVVASTVSLAEGSVSFSGLKWVFGVFFGCFVGALFLCLCCTYYLGANKDSWEIPPFAGQLTWSFSNMSALAGLVIEFIQITSYSFNRSRRFAGINLSWLNRIAVPIGDNDTTFQLIYWIMFVVAFTPYIFVIVVRIVIYVYTARKGELAAANLVDKFQEKVHSVLWFLVNALYFPVIGTSTNIHLHPLTPSHHTCTLHARIQTRKR